MTGSSSALAAGGSELTLAAGVDRADAPARARRLIQLVRAVAAGAPLDAASGRHLEVALSPVTILVAGGRDGMLRTAGSHADLALVWAAATSDLERVVGVIRRAAAGRTDGGPQIVWAPLVELAEDPGADVAGVAVYAASTPMRPRWLGGTWRPSRSDASALPWWRAIGPQPAACSRTPRWTT